MEKSKQSEAAGKSSPSAQPQPDGRKVLPSTEEVRRQLGWGLIIPSRRSR